MRMIELWSSFWQGTIATERHRIEAERDLLLERQTVAVERAANALEAIAKGLGDGIAGGMRVHP